MDEYIGTIKLFGFSFPPVQWATCNGALMNIATNTALFSLIGTYYGGNGQTTFGLPDLRGRAPIGQGQGPGLSNYTIGQAAGVENITISTSNLPQHSHPMVVSGADATNATPSANMMLGAVKVGSGPNASSLNLYTSSATPSTALSGSTTGLTGNNTPVSILQPYLAINYCINLYGIFPSRN